jgi:hypothetical protein
VNCRMNFVAVHLKGRGSASARTRVMEERNFVHEMKRRKAGCRK